MSQNGAGRYTGRGLIDQRSLGTPKYDRFRAFFKEEVLENEGARGYGERKDVRQGIK
jgi:hypothetical protein